MNRFLVVDDLEDNRIALGLVLETFPGQVDVVTAASGDEAMSILASDRDFHVVFLDIQMPGMDGFETCRNIRNEIVTPYIPVILWGPSAPSPAASHTISTISSPR